MDEALRVDRPEEKGESDSGELDFAEDSNKKPSFDIMEETQMAFSMISLKKSGVRRTRGDDAGSGSETDKEEPEIEIPKLDEKDEKCFEKVEQLIKGRFGFLLEIDLRSFSRFYKLNVESACVHWLCETDLIPIDYEPGGLLEKLKIDQCKIYLRKYGLRLNGNKGVLLARIREHQE
ncbi:Zinc finger CCCH domain-containing protein 62 [Apostasia shenzhenica]|uniref:Zinc finger CCCH domain-containing protein 62 n=1 Tax=Apostasia shenzhenica TaxID=1088818 RepID=A0A2I0B886_9ASPA|nr:Zinc finger CCCH domain-containing protein 62 [Apostasia shenzhenica]